MPPTNIRLLIVARHRYYLVIVIIISVLPNFVTTGPRGPSSHHIWIVRPYWMELYLTDGRQVFFPGTVVRGTLRVVRPDANGKSRARARRRWSWFCISPSDDVPAVKASGYTLVWKPAARNEEIDERTVFYEDTAVTCPEANDAREPSTTTGTGIRLVLGPRSRMSGDHLNTENACLSGRSKTFEFHLVLPSDLPPSHEVPFGHTRYKLEAHYNGQTVVRHFCVVQWVGLKKRDNKIVRKTIVLCFLLPNLFRLLFLLYVNNIPKDLHNL